MAIKYFLGNLGVEKYSEQAKSLRNIILSDKSDKKLIKEFKDFILAQTELKNDTVQIINKSLMTQVGSEYLGIGGDNYLLKSNLYEEFVAKFPSAFGLKFYYADCSCVLAGNKNIDEIYPLLKEGMPADKENIYYPSTDLFDIISDSKHNFDFDMLLLDKYYQPCDKISFDEYISDFKEKYTSDDKQNILENIIWKGEKTYR
jgi:hypothetical protein